MMWMPKLKDVLAKKKKRFQMNTDKDGTRVENSKSREGNISFKPD